MNNKIFLALGANVGNMNENLRKSIHFLGDKIDKIKVSGFYETKPWGFENQDYFLNCAISGVTELSPKELLLFTQKVENALGRVKRFVNGPREIDIDILFYNDLIYKDSDLEIPHPRISERDFVLRPLMDLDPDFIHPVLKVSIKELFKNI